MKLLDLAKMKEESLDLNLSIMEHYTKLNKETGSEDEKLETGTLTGNFICFNSQLEDYLNKENITMPINFDAEYENLTLEEKLSDKPITITNERPLISTEFLLQDENWFTIKLYEYPSRLLENCTDIFIDFNSLEQIPEEDLVVCDICGKKHHQSSLINFDPATPVNNEIEETLKEEFKDFDGMVCNNCYYEMIV